MNASPVSSVPPEVVTASVSRSGTARAGMVYNLTCTVSKTVGGLANTPTVTWTIGGVAVSTGNGVILSDSTDDMSAIATLTFDPLRTSHEGRYICEGTLTSPGLEMPLTPSTAEPLRAQSKQLVFPYVYTPLDYFLPNIRIYSFKCGNFSSSSLHS